MTDIPSLARADAAGSRLAIVATEGRFTYSRLAGAARSVAGSLLDGTDDLAEARIALMVPPGFRYVATQWGTWAAGGISVPLALSHPAPELEHVLDDADVSMVVASEQYTIVLGPLLEARGIPLLDADELVAETGIASVLPEIGADRRCLILYTSGTTGRAKGVVWRHSNHHTQLAVLSEAWGWSSDDRILLVLPLHHVHGLVNVLGCALWNGATVEMLPRFDVDTTWDRLGSRDVGVFMAVPTIYRRLIAHWEAAPDSVRQSLTAGLAGMRLMVSGSAALPVPTMDAWRRISGQTLLERYGMTEIGMALSNPYDGERTPGAVGMPLPSVDVRLVDDEGEPVAPGTSGEIEARGPSVFSEYWGRPEATRKAFRDGWFRTGDEAVLEGGVYRILGRRSVDIIKSGGEKISALEVEDVLRNHPAVADCAVVGLEDPEWGERVAVAVVAASNTPVELDEIQTFAGQHLAPPKVPRQMIVVGELPQNALGKVVKPKVRQLFEPTTG